jgi:hypothetical protein
LSKWTNDNVVLIGIYVDDCLVIRKDEEIQRVIKDLKTKGFNLKIESSLNDYLSCRVEVDFNSAAAFN